MRIAFLMLALGGCTLPVIHTGPVDAGLLPVGATCEHNADCAGGLCATGSSGQRVCAPNECPSGACSDGKTCAQQSCGTVCIAPLAVGYLCQADGVCQFTAPCSGHDYCAGEDVGGRGKCATPACLSDADCDGGFCDGVACSDCDNGAHACPPGMQCIGPCGVRDGVCVAMTAGIGDVCYGECFPQGFAFDATCTPGLECNRNCDEAQASDAGLADCMLCESVDGGP